MVNNNSEKDNHYKDYLPKNRYEKNSNEKENALFSSKSLKKGLYVFYGVAFIMLIGVILRFNGYNILEVDERNYNMNLAETIDLDAIYKGKDVEWVSNSKNVVVKNNVVTALKSGKAYLYAKIGDKQVKDVDVDILESGRGMNILNHSISLSLGLSGKIKVNRSKDFINKTKKSFFDFSHNQWNNYRKWISNIFGGHKEINAINTDKWLKDNYDNWGSVDEKKSVKENTDVAVNDDNTKIDNNISNIDDNIDDNINDSVDDNIDDSKIIDDEDNFNDESGVVDNNVSNIVDEESTEGYNTIDYSDYSSEGLTYYSTNENIAVVDEDGNIEPVSPGVVSIVVEDENGNRDHSIVTIKEDSLSMVRDDFVLNIGDKSQIKYVLDSEQYKGEDIEWSVDNDEVVKVNDKGEIEAVDEGKAVVVAKVGKMVEKVNIEVTTDEKLPTDLNLSPVNGGVMVGESFEIQTSISFDEQDSSVVEEASSMQMALKNEKAKSLLLTSDIGGLSCASSNERVVTVGDDGIGIAKSVGSAVVTCTTSNGISKSVEVTTIAQTIPVQDITVEKTDIEIDLGGEPYKLDFNLIPENTTERDVQISYDRAYIDIDPSNGTIVGKKAGKTVLEVKVKNGKSIKINITINSKKITDLKFNFTSLKLGVGSSKELSLMYYPADANIGSGVTWATSNANVATVDSTGKVTAKGKGGATITAVVNYPDGTEVSASCEVTVLNTMGNMGDSASTTFSFSSGIKDKLSDSSVLHLKKGDSFSLATYVPSSLKSGAKYEVTSGDSKIVTVDKTGKITVNYNISGHNAVVKVTSGGKTASLKVYTHAASAINVSKVLKVPDDQKTVTSAQMFCIASKYFVVAKRNSDRDDCNEVMKKGINQCDCTMVDVKLYNRTSFGKVEEPTATYHFKANGKKDNGVFTSYSSLYHANDCTYYPSNQKIYVSKGSDNDLAVAKFKYNSSSIVSDTYFTNSNTGNKIASSGIGYDRNNNKWVVAKGCNIFYYKEDKTPINNFTNANGKKVNYFPKNADLCGSDTPYGKQTPQGIGVYGGKVLVMRFNGGKKDSVNNKDLSGNKWKGVRNAVDIYRLSNGQFLGSYAINTGDSAEIESVDWTTITEDGTNKNIIYFYVNLYKDTKKDYIVRAAGIRVPA